jgi:hypothetical protein
MMNSTRIMKNFDPPAVARRGKNVQSGEANALIRYIWIILFCLIFATAGCNNGNGDDPDPDPQPERTEILRSGTNGVFDAAPGRTYRLAYYSLQS